LVFHHCKYLYYGKFDKNVIEEYFSAFEKVVKNCEELLKDDPGDPPTIGNWGLTFRI
jgi:hypothetical protein